MKPKRYRSPLRQWVPPIGAEEVRHFCRNHVHPARRHRCEICHYLFECHHCTIPADAQQHVDHPDRLTNPMFICEECEAALDIQPNSTTFWRYAKRLERWKNGLLLHDLPTGKDRRRLISRKLPA